MKHLWTAVFATSLTRGSLAIAQEDNASDAAEQVDALIKAGRELIAEHPEVLRLLSDPRERS